MPKISKEKLEKISEQVLSHLYSVFPKQIYTSEIAKELARDEEFIKKIMQDLESKSLVIKINKNSTGKTYSRRLRWRISNKIYNTYKNLQ